MTTEDCFLSTSQVDFSGNVFLNGGHVWQGFTGTTISKYDLSGNFIRAWDSGHSSVIGVNLVDTDEIIAIGKYSSLPSSKGSCVRFNVDQSLNFQSETSRTVNGYVFQPKRSYAVPNGCIATALATTVSGVPDDFILQPDGALVDGPVASHGQTATSPYNNKIAYAELYIGPSDSLVVVLHLSDTDANIEWSLDISSLSNVIFGASYNSSFGLLLNADETISIYGNATTTYRDCIETYDQYGLVSRVGYYDGSPAVLPESVPDGEATFIIRGVISLSDSSFLCAMGEESSSHVWMARFDQDGTKQYEYLADDGESLPVHGFGFMSSDVDDNVVSCSTAGVRPSIVDITTGELDAVSFPSVPYKMNSITSMVMRDGYVYFGGTRFSAQTPAVWYPPRVS